MGSWGYRAVVGAAATTLVLGGLSPSALAAGADDSDGNALAAKPELLLVHGHGDASAGKSCNSGTWKNALEYFEGAGNMDPSLITTIGHYEGNLKDGKNDGRCDDVVSQATSKTKIQDIAKDFANYISRNYTEKGRPVNIVAHSMGGLVTRVALLGTAQKWDGFPSELDVNNVVTLGTPHQGLKESQVGGNADAQWEQMEPGSEFLTRLHENGSELGDAWSKGTDWSVVGSNEDSTVSYNSAIDEGNQADQKFGYKDNGGVDGDGREAVTHTKIRIITGPHRYDLTFWHKSGDHDPHHTPDQGWAPLKTAFKAATTVGDDLPR